MKLFAITLLVFLFILGCWFAANFFLFESQKHERAILLQRISEQTCVQNELIQIEKQGDYQKKYDAIFNAELEAIRKKIPPTAEASNLLALLHQIAGETKIVLHNFQVGKIKPLGIWFELPVMITLSGSFSKLIDFLKKIALQERLLVVQDLKFGSKQAMLQISAYFGDWRPETAPVLAGPYRCGEYVVPASINSILVIPNNIQNPIPKLSRDPFIIPDTPLSLKGLHLTGLVQQGDEWMALLEDDQGDGRVVKMGSAVVDGFTVTQITNHSVSLSKGNEIKQLTWSD